MVVKCDQCGRRLRRVHRTFIERFAYMAVYACRECDREQVYPRRYTYHFGPHCRCPRCGTLRVTRLRVPDKIDGRNTGFLNFLEKRLGGRLYHCRYCRLQFWDRRMLASEDVAAATQEEPAVASPADQAARARK